MADSIAIQTPRTFQAQAVLVGTGIDLAALGATERTGGAPLLVELIGTLTGTSLREGLQIGRAHV